MLRFINKGVPKDEVWIHVPSLDMKDVVGLKSINYLSYIGDYIESNRSFLYEPIRFFIYKKQSSWIEHIHTKKKIHFMYDIKPSKLKDSKGGYTLSFNVQGKMPINIQVKDSCYPKKYLIKQLLNQLVK